MLYMWRQVVKVDLFGRIMMKLFHIIIAFGSLCLFSDLAKAESTVDGGVFSDPAFVLSDGRANISGFRLYEYTAAQSEDFTISVDDRGSEIWVTFSFQNGIFRIADSPEEQLGGFGIGMWLEGASLTSVTTSLTAEVHGDAGAYLTVDMFDPPGVPGLPHEYVPFGSMLTYRDTLQGDVLTANISSDSRSHFSIFSFPQVNAYAGESFAQISGFTLVLEVATVPEPNGIALMSIGVASLLGLIWRHRRGSQSKLAQSGRPEK